MGSDTSDMASKEFDNLNVAQSTVQHDGHDSHPPPTRAYFSGLNILAVGFNICSCWIGVGTTFPLAVASGGAATLIYGIVLVSFVFLCLGLTLAELASVYPTAGGQYHFASILAPTSISRGVSYACGTTAAFSWVAIVASVAVLISQGLLGIVREFVVSYDSKTWHLLLVYLVWSGVAMLYNLLLLRKTTWMYNIALVFNISLFVVVTVTCVSRAPVRPATRDVWSSIVNSSGWPDGVLFLVGTLTPQFMFAGFDGALHLAEECIEPSKVVPRALIATVITGSITAFVFAVGMACSLSNLTAVLNTPTGFPIYAAFRVATGSEVAATVFLSMILILGTVTLIAVQQTASRMTWAFARDNALFGSHVLGRMNSVLGVPVWALLINYAITVVIGILIVVSSAAFNAVIGSAALLQQISFGIPAALLLYRRWTNPGFLPESQPFRLPTRVGYFVNIVVVLWTLVALVFYDIPPTLPVTGTNMNYSSAVLSIIGLFGAGNWYMHAKKQYRGPIQVDGVVIGLAIEG